MVKAGIGELFTVVNFLVESHDARYVVQPEVGEVGLRGVEGVAVFNLGLGMGAAECKKFLRHEPIEITVLNFLVMFIFIIIKVFKIEKVGLFRFVNRFETVEDGDRVDRYSKTRVTERYERGIEATDQRLEGLLRSFAQVDDAVGRDEEGSIGPFVAVQSGVVNNLLLCQRVGLKFSVQFGAIPIKIDYVTFEDMQSCY